MTNKSSFSEVHLDVNPGTERISAEHEPDTPFRILLMGDFSGRSASNWKPLEIDRDNFEEVLAGLKPEAGGLAIRELDDFHPDRIRLQPLFRQLREARRKTETAPPAASARPAEPERAPLPKLAPGASLLDSMVEAAEPAERKTPPPAARRGGLEAVVESFVAPYRIPAEDPEVARAQAASDAEQGMLMRAILHDPLFQALESAWRAVFQLVRAIETSTQLKVYLIDVSKAELAADLHAAADPLKSRLGQLLLREGDPWSVVAANHAFAQTPGDVAMLGRLGRIMSAAGAPFLAEADPAGGGPEAENSVQLWAQLRQAPEAHWIGLAMPRLLLRLPYGKKTDRVESFDFEEMPGVPSHQHYLWGSPAFACAQMLGDAFASDGWEMQPGAHTQIEGLPLHVYEDEGEAQAKPCAEVFLTESDLDWVMEQGYMAMASIRGSDAVRLVRFQSIANPAARLAGRWEA